ncbi:MAG: 50S ribosomal protein L6 [Acidobacteria bacterium]|nr:50S ribosomal protein L6 [Acidobacteriota bacterium]
MSRVGKNPIAVPSGAQVEIVGAQIRVKGPKGELTAPIPAGIEAKLEDGKLEFTRQSDLDAAKHGLARALAANAVRGVTQGFTKQLEIVGIGYRAAVAGRVAVFSLGYSHPIEVLMPEGIEIKVDAQTKIEVSGADRQKVGQISAMIRQLRPPDPYKQKGVRYAGEELLKKEGKTGSK